MALFVVAESIGLRFEVTERFHLGLLLRCIGAARSERNGDVVAGILRCFFDTCAACQNDQVGKRNSLAARLTIVELFLDAFKRCQYRTELERVVDLPILLRLKANSCPIRTAAFIAPAERRRLRPCR